MRNAPSNADLAEKAVESAGDAKSQPGSQTLLRGLDVIDAVIDGPITLADLAAKLDARGVLVVLDAAHECLTMRGERQPDASTVTIAARGALAEPAARAEVVLLLGARP